MTTLTHTSRRRGYQTVILRGPESTAAVIAVSPALESDAALALGMTQARAISPAQESDAALALAQRQTLAVGIASEQDSALALGVAQASAIGPALESDSAGTVSPLVVAVSAPSPVVVTEPRARPAVRSIVRFPRLIPATSVPVSPALESDSALSIGARMALAVTLAAETDAALAVGRSQAQALTLAGEVDSALPIGQPGIVGTALESDSALSITAGQRQPLGLAAETDAALPVAGAQARAVGTALESDSALPLTPIAPIGLAGEVDEALGIGASGVVIVVPSVVGSATVGSVIIGTYGGRPAEMAPCAWPIQVCTPEWDTYTPEVQARAITWATEMLWMRSGRQFGACAVTVRPCGQPAAGYGLPNYGVIMDSPGGATFMPYIADGKWRNCGCYSLCQCAVNEEVWLPGPVAGVSEVRIDGVVVDPTAYRVDMRSYLVRHDGGTWPRSQDLNLPAGQPNTWTVTYLRGEPVPETGEIAAGALAADFAAACVGGPCRLPQGVQSIVRQGTEMTLINDPSVGDFGVWEADQWIKAVNPYHLAQRPRIFSLDIPQPRQTTWAG